MITKKIMKIATKKYINLAKPGIIRGNAIVAIAGFLFASKGDVDLWLLISLVVGSSLIMASACVFNNYLDKDIDALMDRTKKRSFVSKEISEKYGLLYGLVIGILGFGILLAFTNKLTAIVGLIGFIDYVALYTYAKRHSIHSTLIGTISGATPPVAGYVAVTNDFDIASLMLFLILVFWQMPHFYAIGIMRISDYKKAHIPLLPIIHGIQTTKIQMLIYGSLLIGVLSTMTAIGLTGYAFLAITLAVSINWLFKIYKGFDADNDQKWAGKIFGYSLKVLLVISIMLSLDSFLP